MTSTSACARSSRSTSRSTSTTRSPTASFIDDLGADSLAIVELVLAFEEEFELDIPDEETERIRTVQNAIDYISSRVNQSRPASA